MSTSKLPHPGPWRQCTDDSLCVRDEDGCWVAYAHSSDSAFLFCTAHNATHEALVAAERERDNWKQIAYKHHECEEALAKERDELKARVTELEAMLPHDGELGLPWRKERMSGLQYQVVDASNQVVICCHEERADRILAAVNRPTQGGAFTRVGRPPKNGGQFYCDLIGFGFDDMTFDGHLFVGDVLQAPVPPSGDGFVYMRSIGDIKRLVLPGTIHALEFRDGRYQLGPEIKPDKPKVEWPEKMFGFPVEVSGDGVKVGCTLVSLSILKALGARDLTSFGGLEFHVTHTRPGVITVAHGDRPDEHLTLDQLRALIAACEKAGAQ